MTPGWYFSHGGTARTSSGVTGDVERMHFDVDFQLDRLLSLSGVGQE
jgi:hypothetical protein